MIPKLSTHLDIYTCKLISNKLEEDEDYRADTGEDGDEVLVIDEKSSRTSPLTKVRFFQ